ncbi:hypothetical protein EV644_15117, partial [Kribbella orskensis]
HIDTHHGHWTITLHHGTATVARPTWAEPHPTRTRYRTPTTSHRDRGASDSAARNHAHHPAPTTTTGNTPAAQFDPWADTDPPDPGPGSQTRPPGDPPPGHRALRHAGNPPGAAADGPAADRADAATRAITEDADARLEALDARLDPWGDHGLPTGTPTQTAAENVDVRFNP